MIDMHSNYDNMHKIGMFYVLIYINNHIIACVNCMLSTCKVFSLPKFFFLPRNIFLHTFHVFSVDLRLNSP